MGGCCSKHNGAEGSVHTTEPPGSADPVMAEQKAVEVAFQGQGQGLAQGNGHASMFSHAANSHANGHESSTTQVMALDGHGPARPDSPGMRITTRVKDKPKQDGIVTVWDDGTQTPSPHCSHRTSAEGMVRRGDPIIPGSLMMTDDSRTETTTASPSPKGWLPRQDSTKASSPAILTFQQGPSHQPLQQPHHSLEDSLEGLKPAHQAPARSRYAAPAAEMVLSLSDDEEDDEQSSTASNTFDMLRWKRHYHWNKGKHQELLRFLWKRFDKRHWTVYCISYLYQDALLASYQGENVIHGFQCRVQQLLAEPAFEASGLQSAGSAGEERAQDAPPLKDIFGVLHTLVDPDSSAYKVVGVLIARGTGSHPACLSPLLELSDWQVKPADVSDPLVRAFVSDLITRQPPALQYQVAHTAEIL